jgi:hypothetical protein
MPLVWGLCAYAGWRLLFTFPQHQPIGLSRFHLRSSVELVNILIAANFDHFAAMGCNRVQWGVRFCPLGPFFGFGDFSEHAPSTTFNFRRQRVV